APMTKPVFAPCADDVKSDVLGAVSETVDDLLTKADEGATPRELERATWLALLKLGRLLLMYLFGLLARRATERDLDARDLGQGDVRLRNERDYCMTIKTTLGEVTFPTLAYRDTSSGVVAVTRTPAREVFPLRKHCMSSELLLEWETRLGSEHPFRRAQEAMTFFTHGAVTEEDTTIADHMVAVGRLVDRDWCYRPADEIEEILRTRATIDLETGKSIIYASTDGEFLRRYVDETWEAQWKQACGVRLWCVDRHNGATIHLGGEYTWGDCNRVREVFEWLIDTGRLPADGRYHGGLVAQIVIPTDGARWIRDHVLPLFAPHAQPILDPYHAMEHLGGFVRKLHPKDKQARQAWYSEALDMLLGEAKRPRKKKAKKRRGQKRPRRGPGHQAQPAPAVSMPPPDEPSRGEVLLEWLRQQALPTLEPAAAQELREELDSLIGFIENNVHRMDYVRYRAHGYQIGSGAMEALHRGATQIRLKLPGPGWLETTSAAVFNIRMMFLAGRWDEFWSQPDLTDQLVAAFAAAREEKRSAQKEAA
ncbi:MAG: hypothetical protein ACE5JM_15860, partial [Armatimonadota bacterium]